MLFYKKVLSIDNVDMIVKNDSFGKQRLYPNGTNRTIKALTFRGWKILNQITTIKLDVNDDSFIYYNYWETI